jgi:hypothetical protein
MAIDIDIEKGRRSLPMTGAAAGLALALMITLGTARDAHAWPRRGPGPHGHVGLAIGAALVGAAIGAELSSHVWLDLHGGAPPPVVYYGYGGPPYPPPPCCYQPLPPPPPPLVIGEPMYAPPVAYVPTLGLAVNGLIQAPQARSATAGVAVSLQARTSARTLFALEVQSLRAERPDRQRDDLAGLLVGRLFAWDAPLAPYL